MNRWEERRLGDLIEINPETMSVSKYKGYINYIDIGAVNKGNLEGYVSYDITEAPSRARRIVRDDDIIFSSVRPNLRAYYYMKDSPQNAVCSTGFTVLRASIGLIDSKFLYYLVTENSFVDYLSLVATGSAYPAVDTTDFKKAKVTVPLLSVQKRIGDILSKYDDLIENNNKRIKILEQMAENLYKEWFVRFRFPGYEDAEFENGLPKGWEYLRLDKVVTVFYGKDHSKLELGDIPVYGSGGLMRYGNRALYEGESVLIPRKGSLNNIMWVNHSFWTVDTMFYTKALIPHIEKYIFYVLSSLDMASFNTGAALPSMTTDILYHLKIMVPSITVLSKFDNIVSKLYEQRVLLENVNQNLIKQRDRLLPRLMSGKLEV